MLEERPFVGFLLITDAARAKEFYCDVLGLPLRHEDDFAVVVDAGGTPPRLSIVAEVPEPVVRTPGGSSTTSTALCVRWSPQVSHSNDSPAWTRTRMECGDHLVKPGASRGSETPMATGSRSRTASERRLDGVFRATPYVHETLVWDANAPKQPVRG